MEIRDCFPVCGQCLVELDLDKGRGLTCGHWLCVDCLPPGFSICPIDGAGSPVSLRGDQEEKVRGIFQRMELEVGEVTEELQLLRQHVNYLKNAIIESAKYLTDPIAPAIQGNRVLSPVVVVQEQPIPIPSLWICDVCHASNSAMLSTCEECRGQLPLGSSFVCPFCKTFKSDTWDPLRVHMEERYIVKRSVPAAPTPQQTSIIEESKLVNLPLAADLTTIERNLYQIYDEAKRELDQKHRHFTDIEMQAIWMKLLETLLSCEIREFGSILSGFISLDTVFDILIQVDSVHFAFPQYESEYQELSKDRKDKLLPFARRYTLDKVTMQLQKIGYQFFSAVKLHSPMFKFKKQIVNISVNVTVADEMTLASSELLGAYANVHSEIMKPLGCAVKYWAKARGVTESMSPYVWLLMLISFLQHSNNFLPYLSPNPTKVQSDYLTDLGEVQRSRFTTSQLLLEFYKYYSCKFDWNRNYVSITAPEIYPKAKKRWQYVLISIEDPFDQTVNLTQVTVRQEVSDDIAKAILEEIKSAYYWLSQGNDFFSVCQHHR